jgi:hypothetical protein
MHVASIHLLGKRAEQTLAQKEYIMRCGGIELTKELQIIITNNLEIKYYFYVCISEKGRASRKREIKQHNKEYL